MIFSLDTSSISGESVLVFDLDRDYNDPFNWIDMLRKCWPDAHVGCAGGYENCIVLPSPTRYVALENLRSGECFWTSHRQGTDPTIVADGTRAYRILGFFNDSEACTKFVRERRGIRSLLFNEVAYG